MDKGTLERQGIGGRARAKGEWCDLDPQDDQTVVFTARAGRRSCGCRMRTGKPLGKPSHERRQVTGPLPDGITPSECHSHLDLLQLRCSFISSHRGNCFLIASTPFSFPCFSYFSINSKYGSISLERFFIMSFSLGLSSSDPPSGAIAAKIRRSSRSTRIRDGFLELSILAAMRRRIVESWLGFIVFTNLRV